MTPAARVAAAIEILHGFESSSEPVDRRLERWFRPRRFAGSKDRRAIRELVYLAARNWGLAAYAADSCDARLVVAASLMLSGDGDAASVKAMFGADRYAPAPLDEAEARKLDDVPGRTTAAPPALRHGYPPWLESELRDAFGDDLESEMAALQHRAPVDLRVNTLKVSREEAQAVLADQGMDAVPTPLSPVGLRCAAATPVTDSAAYRDGLVEIQDEASQIAALLAGTRAGDTVIDYCAGGGGKSLAMAAAMKGEGRIVACDVSAERLSPLSARASRAGVGVIECTTLGSETGHKLLSSLVACADRVLVDAPCSGTGTWRRTPDARWLLTPERLESYRQAQQSVLREAALFVRPGGRLIYATCSILPSENEQQVSSFLDQASGFRCLPIAAVWAEFVGAAPPVEGAALHLTLTPCRTGTDGFFVTVLEKADD